MSAKRKSSPRKSTSKYAEPVVPDSALLTHDWAGIELQSMTSRQLDSLLKNDETSIQESKASDQRFLKRATLDLVGHPPTPEQIEAYFRSSESTADRRSQYVDQLLASRTFAEHWARYWTDTMLGQKYQSRSRHLERFERWLADEIHDDASWSQITAKLITAAGQSNYESSEYKNAVIYFLARHEHPEDSAIDRAAEVSRIFLGIQIQCAQCHDHVSDRWKRAQFHHMSGFFARLDRGRRIRETMVLAPLARGEHTMKNIKLGRGFKYTSPRFLDGQAPKRYTRDTTRRQALANYLTDKKNLWFSMAYVNRMWSELMDEPFFATTDDIGPDREMRQPEVARRLAAHFSHSGHDIKQLFRIIANSNAYQNAVATAKPNRLRSNVVLKALDVAFETVTSDDYWRKSFQGTFYFDPARPNSSPSIDEALLLMNDSNVQGQIHQNGRKGPKANLVDKIMLAGLSDEEATKQIYQQILVRNPTANEIETCVIYLKDYGEGTSRASALEDIVWTLVNSTEFLHRH